MELIGRRSGLKYKPIINIYNSYCYYISSAQKILSSATFRRKIPEINRLQYPWNEILSIFSIYQNSNPDFKKYEEVINKYFDHHMNNGGFQNQVMSYIFLPLIYKFFNNDFLTIFEEVSFKWIYIQKAKKKTFNFFKDNNMNNKLFGMFEEMYNYLQINTANIHYKHPEVLLCSLYLVGKSGHAVNVVDTNNGVYVMDDSEVFKPLRDYLNELGDKFVSVTISDFDKEFEKLIPQGNFKEEARIHKISLTNWKHVDDAKYLLELARGELDSETINYEFDSNGIKGLFSGFRKHNYNNIMMNSDNSMIGGVGLGMVANDIFINTLPYTIKTLIWILNILLFSLILLIIILKILKVKNNKKIQEYQNKIHKMNQKLHKDVVKKVINKNFTLEQEIEDDSEKRITKAIINPLRHNKTTLFANKLFTNLL